MASKQGIVDEDWARQLRCMELQIQLLPQRPWTLPDLPQALLGQQLKEALYQLLCYRADQDCAACERLERCSIPNWFTPQLRLSGQMRSFTLGVEHTPGERLDPYHPFCIRMVFLLPPPFSELMEAVRLLGVTGLGRQAVPHTLHRVIAKGEHGERLVLEEGIQRMPWPSPGRLESWLQLPEPIQGVQIEMLTPLQLPRSRRPHPEEFIRAAIGRVRSVAALQGLSLERWWRDPRGLKGRWRPLRRVRAAVKGSGGRQDLSGWMGTLHLGEEAQRYGDLLAAAQLLGVGSKTSSGLGRFLLHWI